MTPAVPEVSVLDESNPLEAPQPERLAIHQNLMEDHRLNRSPLKQVNQVTYQPHKPDQAARKVCSCQVCKSTCWSYVAWDRSESRSYS